MLAFIAIWQSDLPPVLLSNWWCMTYFPLAIWHREDYKFGDHLTLGLTLEIRHDFSLVIWYHEDTENEIGALQVCIAFEPLACLGNEVSLPFLWDVLLLRAWVQIKHLGTHLGSYISQAAGIYTIGLQRDVLLLCKAHCSPSRRENFTTAGLGGTVHFPSVGQDLYILRRVWQREIIVIQSD